MNSATHNEIDDGNFLFVGDVLALDLVNTDCVVRGKRIDLLAEPGAATRWWGRAQAHYPDRATVYADVAVLHDERLREALSPLRSTLRGIFSALAEDILPAAQAVEQLNEILSSGQQTLEFRADGSAQLSYRCDVATTTALLPIALSAVWLSTSAERQRLHACSNSRCVLLFYDTTKSGTRRWCSLGCKDRDRKMKQHHRSLGTTLD